MPTPSRPNRRDACILVVDDQKDDRSLLVNCLRDEGYRLHATDNGLEGFELARFIQPDLVILDVRMPGCDGIACCRLLKSSAQTAGIPVIFVSAAAQPRDRVDGLREGAVDYIAKPFDFDEVRLRVAVHLDRAGQGAAAVLPSPPAPADGEPALPHDEGSVDDALFRAAHRRMEAMLSDPHDLEGLARAVGTRPKRLNEASRRRAATTVFDYLRELRMRRARELLVQTRIDIQAVASGLGYQNAGNFATAFRERFGMTPRSFRQLGGAGPAGGTHEPFALLTAAALPDAAGTEPA